MNRRGFFAAIAGVLVTKVEPMSEWGNPAISQRIVIPSQEFRPLVSHLATNLDVCRHFKWNFTTGECQEID
jgi:hypothetical protein